MSALNPTQIIDDIIRREGGFVNHPSDRGGPTKYGITKATLADWRGHAVTMRDVLLMNEPEARDIYRNRYLYRPNFYRIDHETLAALVVDCGVNHGTRRAAQWLQQAAGVTDDGIVGPITLAAVNGQSEAALYRAVLATRARFYGRLVTDSPSQAVFAAGWASRLAEFIEVTP